MKRKTRFAVLICLSAAILITGFAACTQKETPVTTTTTTEEPPPLVGGYSQDREITPEDKEIFNEVMDGMTGVSYELISVATQVVAGMNYRFRVTGTPVAPEAEPFAAYIYIFKPLGDGTPELTQLERLPD